MLPGPAGRLEALLNVGELSATHAALVCHPHPMFGGTMHNKVVYNAMKALAGFGFPVLRFNFRGAGLSEGTHDEGRGEVDDVRAALECALALSESYRDDDALSDVRVGLAAGPVLEREGDLYGPTVNLASRIVSIAFAGSVVVDSEVHDACQDEGAFQWRSLRTRHLKDIGRDALWVVRRTDDGFENEGAWDRARRRREVARNRVAELLSARDPDSPSGS